MYENKTNGTFNSDAAPNCSARIGVLYLISKNHLETGYELTVL